MIRRLSGRRQCIKSGHLYHVDFDPPKNEDGYCDIDGTRLFQRDDDKPETVRKRLATYHDKTEPLIDYYEERGLLRRFDGTRERERGPRPHPRHARDAAARRTTVIVRKTPAEIEAMAKAGEIHVRTMDLLAGKVRAGVTTGELDAAAEKFIRSQGATPAFKGYRGFPGSICASPNHMVVHGIPGKFKLRKGDILSVDIGVVKDGWVADGARTFAVGEVSPVAAKLLQVTEESLFEAVEQCEIGNRLGDVSHAVQAHVEAHGLSVVRSLVGHGIGRSMHEEPQIPNYGPARQGRRARGGHGARDRADGHRRPPHGADGRRRLGDLLPGRLAGRALRVHGRDHGRRAADPDALARGRAARRGLSLARSARRRGLQARASAATPKKNAQASPSATSTAAMRRLAPVALAAPVAVAPRARPRGRGPGGRIAPALPLERRAARRVHLAGEPARARRAPAARGSASTAGVCSLIRTSRGRTRRPRPSASSFGSGHVRSRSPGTKYAACEPRATKTPGGSRARRTKP